MTNVLESQIEMGDGNKYLLGDILESFDIRTDTKFIEEFNAPINLNGSNSSRSVWNLICSRRDIKLWQVGMKPNNHWRVSDVKKYFGIKGNKDTLVDKIEILCEIFLPQRD